MLVIRQNDGGLQPAEGEAGAPRLAGRRHARGPRRRRRRRREPARAGPYWLSAPALAVYAAFLVVPLASIALISFQHFEFYGGIQPGFTLENYRAVLGDSYYWEIFGRTFAIAALVTVFCAVLGTFEAIVLYRMANPWKSLFLLVVLGPLLISVVVRTLGWALLFGSTGLINKALRPWARSPSRSSSCTRRPAW